MMRRSLFALPLAAVAVLGCTDSTEPTGVVPRQLYYFGVHGGYVLGVDALRRGSRREPAHAARRGYDFHLGRGSIPSFAPWVSRDGSEIKVLVRERVYDGPFSLATVDPQGTLLSLVPYPDSVPTYPPLPSLSPDGTQMA